MYIDLGFFEELQSKLGARGGPLAEAYILAHEYGHHVQDLTGTLRSASRDTGPQGGQVRLELQADCYAGLWVGHALDTGFVEDITRQDVADALDAAAAVGDDRIQERAQGRVTPESWTHGSSEQRKSWFIRASRAPGPRAATPSAVGSEPDRHPTRYCDAARSANLAYRFRKLSFTESVGPFLCLARITSARPCESDSSPL